MARECIVAHFAGIVTGAGLALFVLYVLSHAVSITIVGWPRIAIGIVGLALWVGGGLWQRKLSSTHRRAASSLKVPSSPTSGE